VARGRGGLEQALSRIRVPTLAVGIWSDVLYPAYQQRQIASLLDAQGCRSRYVEIDSQHGHDSFLIDLDQVGAALGPFLDKPENL
jgi:homoserine O-acetyltransferase/O-succinyltransferase